VTVSHVEVLVEEQSMQAALQDLLPRILGSISVVVHAHQGKRDLLGKLPSRLRGYARWITESYRIVVIVDRDDDDCHELKARLEAMAASADLATRSSTPDPGSIRVIPRIAIEELESWYFGDWQAVRTAYPAVPREVITKRGFRDPDAIRGGTWEAFERVLQKAGYFAGGLSKIEAARKIAPHMDPERNRSASFCALRDALVECRSSASKRP